MYYLSNFGKNNKTIYGVWWKNRSTSTVVSAANSSEARKKAIQKKKEGYGSVKGVKLLDDADARLARAGKWVRTRFDSKSSSQKSKYRPQLAAKQTRVIKSY
jgi:hypothetical protein